MKTKDLPTLAKLSDPALDAYIEKLDAAMRPLTQEFIAAGRGNETMNETWSKTDPLARRWQALAQPAYEAREHRSERRRLGSKCARDRVLGRARGY